MTVTGTSLRVNYVDPAACVLGASYSPLAACARRFCAAQLRLNIATRQSLWIEAA